MNSFFEYTLHASVSLFVFYLFYWLVLRKGTHFQTNRAVLLLSVIVSMLLPLVPEGTIKTPVAIKDIPSFSLVFSIPSAIAAPDSQLATDGPVNFRRIITMVYLAGLILVLARLIYQAIFLHAVSRLSKKVMHDGYTIVYMNNDIIPFSYFNRIYIPSSRVDESSFDCIVAHEKSHLNQGHYVDLFIIEVLTVLQWFNPVVWLYEKSIKEIHEYLADEAVLSGGHNLGKYQALLVNQALGGPVFILTNQFNQSLIKKRIMMMKKMKSSQLARLKALMIVPMIAGLLLVFTTRQTKSNSGTGGQNTTISGIVTDGSTGNAVQGGIVIIKGTTTGTITDKEGNYTIMVGDHSPVLVFTHVGYKTQEIAIETNSKINVQLEKNDLVVDFSPGNRLNADADRSQTKDQNADAGSKGERKYVITEELPGYPGGTDALQQFLKANLRYPSEAQKKGIEGKVMVNFVITAEGLISNAKIMRGVTPDIDAEALRLVNLMRGWKPASQNGETLSMAVTMPIEFKLK
jgi:TonB family protein